MNSQRTVKLILQMSVVALLPSCNLPQSIVQETEQFVGEVEMELAHTSQAKNEPSVVKLVQEYSQPWLGPKSPIQVVNTPESEPESLMKRIELTFIEPVSLVELTQQIAAQIEVPITLAADIHTTELSTISWSGTVKEALNHITGRLGYSWRVRNDQIEILHTELGMWFLYVPAIDARWQASVGLSGSVRSDSGGSDLRAQDQVVVSLDTRIFWEQIEASLSGVLTKFGKFSINRLSGELTVTDTPAALKRVSEWVAVKNQDFTTQVLVNFDLYEIHQSNDAVSGFDVSGFVKNAFGKSAAEIRFDSDDGGDLYGIQFTHSESGTVDASDIELMLRKSSGVSRVAKLTSTVIRGLNGLPVPVFFGDETSYLERREVVNSDGVSAVRLLPGKIQDGIAINMLPRVLPASNRVMLNLTVKTTRIKEISRFPQNAGPNDPVIQLPNLESRSALLPVILNSGELLFVAGLDTYRTDDSNKKGLLNKASKIEKRRTSLVLLITPYIIRPSMDFSGHQNWRPQGDNLSIL